MVRQKKTGVRQDGMIPAVLHIAPMPNMSDMERSAKLRLCSNLAGIKEYRLQDADAPGNPSIATVLVLFPGTLEEEL